MGLGNGCWNFCTVSLSLFLFSCSVMSNSLQPHGLQHARLPCPSPSPGACLDSCPLSQWCHPTILSSSVPFSSCLQSFPASGSYPMSRITLHRSYISRVTTYSLDILLSKFWTSLSMSRSSCGFLTCIQVSQETGKVVWYSSPLSAIRVVSSAYLRVLILLQVILISACASSSLAFPMMQSAYKLNKHGDNIQRWCTSFPIWS